MARLLRTRQPWWLESRAKAARADAAALSARPAHVRKITELPDHLLALAREAKAAGLRAEIEQAFELDRAAFPEAPFLEAKNEAGRVFELAGDFAGHWTYFPTHARDGGFCKLLDEALRRDIHFIARHAEDYPQACSNASGTPAGGTTAPGAEEHYVQPESGWDDNTPWRRPGVRLHTLMENWRAEKALSQPGCHWIQAMVPAASIPLGQR